MSLAAASKDAPPRRAYYDRGCSLGAFIGALDPDDRAGIAAMFAATDSRGRRAWSNDAIARFITEDDDYPGVAFKGDLVRRHRNGACGCVTR